MKQPISADWEAALRADDRAFIERVLIAGPSELRQMRAQYAEAGALWKCEAIQRAVARGLKA